MVTKALKALRPLFLTLLVTGLLLLPVTALANGSVWRSFGQVTNQDPLFEIREKDTTNPSAHFMKDIPLTKESAGQVAVLISYTNAEKLQSNVSGTRKSDITGLPYVYGYFFNMKEQKNGRIMEHVSQYLQGQAMRHQGACDNEWKVSYGLFEIPKDTIKARFFLKQASRKGTKKDGRAAWFYRPNFLIVPTMADAKKVVDEYQKNLTNVPGYKACP